MNGYVKDYGKEQKKSDNYNIGSALRNYFCRRSFYAIY